MSNGPAFPSAAGSAPAAAPGPVIPRNPLDASTGNVTAGAANVAQSVFSFTVPEDRPNAIVFIRCNPTAGNQSCDVRLTGRLNTGQPAPFDIVDFDEIDVSVIEIDGVGSRSSDSCLLIGRLGNIQANQVIELVAVHNSTIGPPTYRDPRITIT